MDELIKLLDKNLEYISHEIIDEIIYITVTSTKTEWICPHCGASSSRVHSRYERYFQDLPMQGKKVVVILKNKKIFCDNEKCNATTFTEKFSFLNNKAKRSIRLEDEILRVSSNCSSVAASYLLSTNTATIGKSTICSLLKKDEPLINKSDIKKVCIDDFAIKKREKYGTIMVDINTHRVIDILESRELEQVTRWLKSFPNIEVVSRDGSITYRNAITLAHPQAIQVSDRFHLLKNLTDYCSMCIKRIFPSRVALQHEEKLADSKLDTVQDDRNCSLTLLNKMEKVKYVRYLHAKGYSNRKIARLTGFLKVTVAKYLDKDFSPIRKENTPDRISILRPYVVEIEEKLLNGIRASQIEADIREKGYHGSSSNLDTTALTGRKI